MNMTSTIIEATELQRLRTLAHGQSPRTRQVVKILNYAAIPITLYFVFDLLTRFEELMDFHRGLKFFGIWFVAFIPFYAVLPLHYKFMRKYFRVFDETLSKYRFVAPNGEAVTFKNAKDGGTKITVTYDNGLEVPYLLTLLRDDHGNRHGAGENLSFDLRDQAIARAASSRWQTPQGKIGTVVDADYQRNSDHDDLLQLKFGKEVAWFPVKVLRELPAEA
jgi:hypothetical protein